jgi:hypothetical protein
MLLKFQDALPVIGDWTANNRPMGFSRGFRDEKEGDEDAAY